MTSLPLDQFRSDDIRDGPSRMGQFSRRRYAAVACLCVARSYDAFLKDGENVVSDMRVLGRCYSDHRRPLSHPLYNFREHCVDCRVTYHVSSTYRLQMRSKP